MVLVRRGEGVDVTVSGAAPDGPRPNAVSVTVEVHDGRTPGDLGWQPVPGTAERPNPVWLSDAPPPVDERFDDRFDDTVFERLPERGLRVGPAGAAELGRSRRCAPPATHPVPGRSYRRGEPSRASAGRS